MAHVVGVPKRDPCHKCQLPVFLAERLTVGKRIYHRTCLKCARCGSQLSPGSYYETEIDDEFCCETCPDEELIAAEMAYPDKTLLRNGSNELDLDVKPSTSATVQLKTSVRSSIADRLAFFEQGRLGDGLSNNGSTAEIVVGSKLLQKSVSDEEKTKSLQRMEAAAVIVPPYQMNSAFNNFFSDTGDTGSANTEHVLSGDDSEPTSPADDLSENQMEMTSYSEDESEANVVEEETLPRLPPTQPPVLDAEPIPNKRFTATAQLQLTTTPAINITDDVAEEDVQRSSASSNSKDNAEESSHARDAEANVLKPTPEIRKSEMKLDLMTAMTVNDATTTLNDNTNNNGGHQKEEQCQQQQLIESTATATTTTAAATVADGEASQKLEQKITKINLELSPINVNDCFTKDTAADDDATAAQTLSAVVGKERETEPESRELEENVGVADADADVDVDADASTGEDGATMEQQQEQQQQEEQQQVELRLKPHTQVGDVETTQRLSVVRARLQQFEVIANNTNNNNSNNNSNNINSTAKEDITGIESERKLSGAEQNSAELELSESTSCVQHIIPEEQIEGDELESKFIDCKALASKIDVEIEPNLKPETEPKLAPKPEPISTVTQSLDEVPLSLKTIKDYDENDEDGKPVTTQGVRVESLESVPSMLGTHDKRRVTLPSSKVTGEEYPEDLNPFKSDDEQQEEMESEEDAVTTTEENKENSTNYNVASTRISAESNRNTSRVTTQKHNSSNPFDSSDDEIELEKRRNSNASSTPTGKVPPPRPPPPRISRNPFGEDTDESTDHNFSRRSSLSSSLTKKTPVPTPRSNLSQSQTPTPEPTPRLSAKTLQTPSPYSLQNTSDYYGSANSLVAPPHNLLRNSEVRGSNNSLTSSAGGTFRSRKSRKAPAPPLPPPPVKELFPATETMDSSKASTPSSSTKGTPRLGRKKRPAPAPPKPARLDPQILPQIAVELETNTTAPKNLHSYPLQSEFDSKLSDEEKALLEGKQLQTESSNIIANSDSDPDQMPVSELVDSQRSTRRVIPVDASIIADYDNDGQSDDFKNKMQQEGEHEGVQVVYRRVLIPPLIETPTHESNPLLDALNAQAATLQTHDRQLEKLKDNKEAQNRNRQSQVSASSGAEDSDPSTLYNKSAHGKWKRRKGPAPALPVPPRKVLQMLPLQEIRHELDIIEVQQQGLEKQGVILEKMIRDRCEGQNGEPLMQIGSGESEADGPDKKSSSPPRVIQNTKEVEDLILQLFELVNEKNELFRRQAELMYLRRQHRLEQEQADLEHEIRVLMAQPERNKTDSDKSREEALIARLVEVVQLRNEVVDCLEMDRLREAEEDMSIKQRLELHTSMRESDGKTESKKEQSKLSKKERKRQKDAKKLSKNKKIDADKDADETELHLDKLKNKKKKRKFIF